MIPVTGGVVRAAIRSKLQQMGELLFFVQKGLQLSALVVLLQPILVRLQHEPRSQGAKKTDTSLQNMPFFLTEEGHFFWL